MSPTLQNIAENAPDKLKALITEAADDIEKALIAAAESANENDTEAKLGVGFRIVINLDKSQVDYDLSWNVKHKLTASMKLDDPNQTKLFQGEAE